MVCQSCGAQRNEIHARPSRLMAGMTLLLCNECIELKREPRFMIILVGRRDGHQKVLDYIKNRRYVGKEITAKELM